MTNTLVIGLTGSTGAGKSTVSRMLLADGFYVIDADALAREAVAPGSPCLRAIAEQFSSAVLNKDGSLNRAALAQMAFATPAATEALNAIVHPTVIAMMNERLAAAQKRGERTVLLDVPLLFQTHTESLCDSTLAITAPPSVRCARICERDGLTPAQALARMNAQPPDSYYAERATHTLENTGDVSALRKAVDDWRRSIGR